MVILLSACSRHEQIFPRPIRIAIESEPTSLDPRMALDAYSAKINELLYRGLFAYNRALRLEPDLADTVTEISPTQFRFTLKPNQLFHDGTPITAQDVVYTYQWILDPARRSPHRDAFASLETVRTLAPLEVEMTLSKPDASFMGRLTLGIVPQSHGDDPRFAQAPIGSGPFRLIAWERGQYLKVEKISPSPQPSPTRGEGEIHSISLNPPLEKGGRGDLSYFEFWFLPEENLRLLELMHGRIDLVQNGISPALLPVLARSSDIVVDDAPGTNLAYLGFQLRDTYLSHPKVRRAIVMAIDRDRLLRAQIAGKARLADSPLPPQNWAYAPGLPTTSYDPPQAKQLLDEAGFRDPDGDGPLPRFRLTYKTSVQKDRIEMALIISEFLKAVGIEISVESREWGTFFRDIKEGRFQLFSLTWVGLQDPDALYYMFSSVSRPPKGANRGNYTSPLVDAALDHARSTYDIDDRKKDYATVQTQVAQDLPYVLLWYENTIVARRRDICGYKIWPNASFRNLINTYRGKCD